MDYYNELITTFNKEDFNKCKNIIWVSEYTNYDDYLEYQKKYINRLKEQYLKLLLHYKHENNKPVKFLMNKVYSFWQPIYYVWKKNGKLIIIKTKNLK